MAQLALTRFRGDTGFAWVARVLATFWGGITGMVIWYVTSFPSLLYTSLYIVQGTLLLGTVMGTRMAWQLRWLLHFLLSCSYAYIILDHP